MSSLEFYIQTFHFLFRFGTLLVYIRQVFLTRMSSIVPLQMKALCEMDLLLDKYSKNLMLYDFKLFV